MAHALAHDIGQRLEILVVEDDPVNLMVIEQMLAFAGLPVACAVDGLDAVAKAAELRPRLILMDLSMPRMSGFEAAEAIRKQAPGAPPKIIAVTAHATPDQREACRKAGFDGFVPKPIDMQELLSTVTAAIP